MMKREVHTTIIKEVIYDYKWVWLSTLIALFLASWTFLPSLYIKTTFSQEYNSAVNVIIQSISLSYIAGTLFFVLSVIIPTIHGRFSILPSVSEQLIELKKAFGGFMAVSCKEQVCSSDFNLKSFVRRVVQEDCTKYCGEESLSAEEFDYEVHFRPKYLLALSLSLH